MLFQRHVQPDFERHEYLLVFEDLFNDFYPLWRVFTAMLQDDQTGEVFILIDALDECERTTRQIILNSIKNLFAALPENTKGQFKFLITCRPDIDDIEDELRGVGDLLRMDSALINDDLSEYIDAKVDELEAKKGYPPQIKMKVQEALKREAGGTFLWVSLMVAELSRPAVRMIHVEEMLHNLPHGLEETYAAILDKVSAENREPAQFILRCMVAARRPLRKSEIQAAYATWRTGLLKRGEDLEVYSDILSVCSSILFLGSEDDATLNFCHQSVKDFLLPKTPAATAWYYSTNSEAHLHLFRVCWAYLTTEELDGGKWVVSHDHMLRRAASDYSWKRWSDLHSEPPDQFSRHLFLRYAFVEWKIHASASSEALLHSWHKLPINVAQAPALRDSWFLHVSEKGQVAVARLLLENGADIMAKDERGKTPIFRAAECGQVAMAKLLLENGADIEAKDEHGRTPIFMAAEWGRKAVVELLLENGANIEARDNNGRTPIFTAAQNGLGGVVKLLLENGANIEAKDNKGRTPILIAADRGPEAVVKQLLENGAEADTINNDGETPISQAVQQGHDYVVKLLLAHGVNSNSKDSGGRTMLWLAAAKRHLGTFAVLLEHGASMEAEDGSCGPPLWWLVERGLESVIKMVLEKKVVDINAKEPFFGRTPLMLAVENGHLGIVELMIERDDVDVNTKDECFGQTPLSLAAENGYLDMVTILLSHERVEADLKDSFYGRTPLSVAAENGHLGVVERLLETESVDVNSKDTYFGRTALWCAAQNGHTDVIKLLVAKNGVEYDASCRVAVGVNTEIVERGELTMTIVSHDGGHGFDPEYAATNILTDDSSAFCADHNRCYVILRHQGTTVFSLRELGIKAPPTVNYSNPYVYYVSCN